MQCNADVVEMDTIMLTNVFRSSSLCQRRLKLIIKCAPLFDLPTASDSTIKNHSKYTKIYKPFLTSLK